MKLHSHFRRDAVGGEKVKRILENSDSSSSSGNEEEKGETAAKVAKTDNPTDHLVGVKVGRNMHHKVKGGYPYLRRQKKTILKWWCNIVLNMYSVPHVGLGWC